MSKALIVAAEIIKKECSKHDNCEGCFYNTDSNDCVVGNYEDYPSLWDLSKLEKKND